MPIMTVSRKYAVAEKWSPQAVPLGPMAKTGKFSSQNGLYLLRFSSNNDSLLSGQAEFGVMRMLFIKRIVAPLGQLVVVLMLPDINVQSGSYILSRCVNTLSRQREQRNTVNALPENRLFANTGALAPPASRIRTSATLCLIHTSEIMKTPIAATVIQDGAVRIS